MSLQPDTFLGQWTRAVHREGCTLPMINALVVTHFTSETVDEYKRKLHASGTFVTLGDDQQQVTTEWKADGWCTNHFQWFVAWENGHFPSADPLDVDTRNSVRFFITRRLTEIAKQFHDHPTKPIKIVGALSLDEFPSPSAPLPTIQRRRSEKTVEQLRLVFAS